MSGVSKSDRPGGHHGITLRARRQAIVAASLADRDLGRHQRGMRGWVPYSTQNEPTTVAIERTISTIALVVLMTVFSMASVGRARIREFSGVFRGS